MATPADSTLAKDTPPPQPLDQAGTEPLSGRPKVEPSRSEQAGGVLKDGDQIPVGSRAWRCPTRNANRSPGRPLSPGQERGIDRGGL